VGEIEGRRITNWLLNGLFDWVLANLSAKASPCSLPRPPRTCPCPHRSIQRLPPAIQSTEIRNAARISEIALVYNWNLRQSMHEAVKSACNARIQCWQQIGNAVSPPWWRKCDSASGLKYRHSYGVIPASILHGGEHTLHSGEYPPIPWPVTIRRLRWATEHEATIDSESTLSGHRTCDPHLLSIPSSLISKSRRRTHRKSHTGSYQSATRSANGHASVHFAINQNLARGCTQLTQNDPES